MKLSATNIWNPANRHDTTGTLELAVAADF
jgi:hypothetical protein